MKRIVSILLAVCILLGLSIGVFASTMNVAADKSIIKVGDTVVVTVKAQDEFKGIYFMAYNLYYNDTLFELASATANHGKFTVASKPDKDATGTYYALNAMAQDGKVFDLSAGDTIATLTFRAIGDVQSAADATFSLKFDDGGGEGMADLVPTPDAGAPASVTVTPAGTEPSTGYSIAVEAPSTAKVNDSVTANLKISGKDTYNAFNIVVEYDSTRLTYTGISPQLDNSTLTVKKTATGKLLIIGFGADRPQATPLALSFTAKADGDATVKIASANIDEKINSETSDAPKANIITPEATITIGKKMHNVTLEDIFTAGSTTVEDGKDYTFSKADKNEKHYEYKDVSATMDGTTVSVKDNGDGTYTISNVTGELNITGTRTAKSYNVSVAGSGSSDVTYAKTATYGTDYTFTVTEDDQYTYEVSVTVDGKTVTATKSDSEYKISGADIEGDIVITVNKTEKPASTVKVSFEGTGSGDATGDATAKVGKDYTFKLGKKDGYDYTISAKNSDGTDITVTDNGDGTYTIAGANIVSGKDITITITKTAKRDIEVVEYLKLNGKSIFLVTVKGTVDKTKALTYNGGKMFWSEKYNGYAYLVISDKTLDAVTAEAKAATIAETSDAPTEIVYTGDANMSGNVEINDAQFVWGMYNANYSDFTASCTMEKFLRADVNGDKTVDTRDSAAIVDTILG